MAYGNGGVNDASPMEQLIIWLRDDVIGELDAINQYQWHIDNIDNEEIKEVLSHIRDEEKEHFAELTKLIAKVDAIQKEKFLEDDHDSDEEDDNEIGERIAGIKATQGSTIGSLKK